MIKGTGTGVFEDFAEAEVDELDGGIGGGGGEQEILGLEVAIGRVKRIGTVPMDDFLFVAVLEGTEDLAEDHGGLLFGEVFLRHYPVEQLASRAESTVGIGVSYSMTRYMFLASSYHSYSLTMLAWSYAPIGHVQQSARCRPP